MPAGQPLDARRYRICCMLDFDPNSRELLRFFDEKPPNSERHATTLNAVFGEDLGAGLLCHYPAKVCAARTAQILMDANGLPTIPSTRTLLQVEIKNWSAHSSGGRRLRLNASEIEKREFRRERRQRFWLSESGRFKDHEVQKVLSAMPAPGYSFDGASHREGTMRSRPNSR